MSTTQRFLGGYFATSCNTISNVLITHVKKLQLTQQLQLFIKKNIVNQQTIIYKHTLKQIPSPQSRKQHYVWTVVEVFYHVIIYNLDNRILKIATVDLPQWLGCTSSIKFVLFYLLLAKRYVSALCLLSGACCRRFCKKSEGLFSLFRCYPGLQY
jgi:hypothetical protein